MAIPLGKIKKKNNLQALLFSQSYSAVSKCLKSKKVKFIYQNVKKNSEKFIYYRADIKCLAIKTSKSTTGVYQFAKIACNILSSVKFPDMKMKNHAAQN